MMAARDDRPRHLRLIPAGDAAPSGRRGVRKRAVEPRTLTHRELEELVERDRHLTLAAVPSQRPKTRADCVDGPRPCPYVGCRHHLYLDVSKGNGLRLSFPDLEPDQLTETCALDVAAEGGLTLEEVGVLMNLTRERIRQIETRALSRLDRIDQKLGRRLRKMYE